MNVEPVLHVEVNPASSHVSHFRGVVIAEGPLHTQIPGFRVGVFNLIGQESRGASPGGRLIEYRDPAQILEWNAAVGKERVAGAGDWAINGRADLRRPFEHPDIVVKDVVADSETATDRHFAALPGREGEPDARHEVFFGRLGRAESDQTRNACNTV